MALSLEQEPELRTELRALLQGLPETPQAAAEASAPARGPDLRVRAFAARVARTGALQAARAEAAEARDRGLAALAVVPGGPTRDLLVQVASLLLDRSR